MRLEVPGNKLAHAEVQIGGAVMALCDPLPNFVSRSPKDLGGTSAQVLLFVEDVNATVKAAVDAGATLTAEVTGPILG